MKKRKIIYYLIVIAVMAACKKSYQPPAVTANYNFLVVEGVINTGANAATTITLSRSRNLGDTVSIKSPELQAQVSIESDAGTSYALVSQGGGIYQSAALTLDITRKYRLKIITQSGGNYLSDLVVAKQSPAIDSITFKQDKDVTIFVHAHDPQNKTTYYRWEYDETFQYRAAFDASLGVKNSIIFYRDSSTQVYNCWGTQHSNNVIAASTLLLGSDVISYVPLTVIPDSTEKLGVRYSINVFQYALTEEAYRYWDVIKKSTEQTGSIFDLQPSQLAGNIHSTTNSAEPVLGYVSAGSVTQKRIFIDNKQLTDWIYKSQLFKDICVQTNGDQDPNNYLHYVFQDTTYSPYYFITPGIIAVQKTPCLDCTRRGGTPVKPSFWQ
jgi:hypothetical protein